MEGGGGGEGVEFNFFRLLKFLLLGTKTLLFFLAALRAGGGTGLGSNPQAPGSW